MGEKLNFPRAVDLENAGIVGIIRILGIDTDDDNGKNELVIDSSDLTNFSEKYFKYFVTNMVGVLNTTISYLFEVRLTIGLVVI